MTTHIDFMGNNMQMHIRVQTTMKVMISTEMRTLCITVKIMNDQVDMNPSSMSTLVVMMDPSVVKMMTAHIDFMGNNMQTHIKVQTTMMVMISTEMRTLCITVKTMNNQVDMNPSSMSTLLVMMDPSMLKMMTAHIDFMGNNMQMHIRVQTTMMVMISTPC